MRKKATASMLNQRVSQVPERPKLVNLIRGFQLVVVILKTGLVLSDIKVLTYCALRYGVAELDSKLKSNWSTGTGKADAKHKKGRENSLEGVGLFEPDELLGDERANNEDETGGKEQKTNGKFHLLAEEVHHGCDADAGGDRYETDGDAQVVGKGLRHPHRDVRRCEVDHH